jgi:hypothetical protein
MSVCSVLQTRVVPPDDTSARRGDLAGMVSLPSRQRLVSRAGRPWFGGKTLP